MTKRIFALLAGVLIFLALLLFLDIRQSLKELASVDLFLLGVALALVTLTQFLSYSKWKVMYGASMKEQIEKQPLLPIFASVLLSGMLTPARSGDILASLAWKKIQGKVLAWSIFNRITEGVTTILVALLVFALFFRSSLSRVQWLWAGGFILTVAILIYLILNRRTGEIFFNNVKKILERLQHFPFIRDILSFEEKIREQFEFFYDTLNQFKARHILSLLIAITLANRVVVVFVNMAILCSLGVILPWVTVLGILAATWVSSFLSLTPNGIGIGDIAPSLLLYNFGFRNDAGAFILINRLIDFGIMAFWLIWVTLYLKRMPTARKVS